MSLFKLIKSAIAGTVLLFAAACQSGTVQNRTVETGPETTIRAPVSYILGTGDSLRVTVFGQEDLSGEFEIDGTGEIAMPLIGEVEALGKSTTEVAEIITTRLADGYLIEPRVSVDVTNYRPYYILGEVRTPGEYPYNSGLTVRNAVASAGGFTYRANEKIVFIKPFEGTEELAIRLDSRVQVQPGDTIRIGERLF